MPTREPPLRLALSTPDYPPDPMGTGIGTYAKSLAEGLARRGHVVHVVTRGPSGEATERHAGVTVHRIGVPRPEIPPHLSPLAFLRLAAVSAAGELRYRARVARRLHELVAAGEVDLVEAADSFVEAAFYRPGRHPTVPFVIRLHTPMSVGERFDRNLPEAARLVLRRIERGYLLRASHLSVPSRTPRAEFRRAMALYRRPIEVIPNPPPSGDTEGAPADGAAGAPRMRADDGPEVLYLGRVTAVKGVHVLAEAIPLVLEQVPEARFRFVGADSASASGRGSTIEALRASLPEPALERVRFQGRVPLEAVDGFLRGATVCVFPSLFENFPYTCLEAMRHGRAIVGSSAGGMRDMLAEGAAGLLYDPPDASDLARALVRLLHDPQLRARLGAEARRRAHEVYGEEAVLHETLAFYRRAVEASG